MAFPPGITPKTVTIGIGSFFNGDLVGGKATITAPVNVIHGPSNRPIFSGEMQRTLVDGEATWNLVPTDAPGLNRLDWMYKLKVEISGAIVQPEIMYFTLPTAGPDVIDLDSLVTVPSSAGTPVSVQAVTVADINTPTSATAVALRAAFVPFKSLALNPDLLIAGTITRDSNGAATSAPVVWPDGSPGAYAATTVSAAFPGAVDAYTITYGSPVTKTYTQPAVTRDATTGAVTVRPALTVA